MKQSLARGRFLFIFVAFGLVSCFSACIRLPRTNTPTTRLDTPALATSPAPINLNTASAAQLEQLPGVGPVLAERIIAHRDEHGHFRRTEHLMMVRGISDRKFRELRSLVRVE